MSYKLPPKYQRYADRLHELINEGKQVLKLGQQAPGYQSEVLYISGKNRDKFHNWFVKAESLLSTLFGETGSHYRQFEEAKKVILPSYFVNDIYRVIGTLEGSLDDLENGFLLNQEFLVASDVFDSVLEQATHLLKAGYKDPAAVLCRVVVEDSLKRLARANGLDDTKKAALINQDLKQANIYSQPQWRQIDTWLDIGNKAAHGDFAAYNDDEVKRMIEGIEAFLASYLSVV